MTPYSGRMNVLLGADSLALHRSGVGRMTLEIARELRRTPAVQALRLLVNGQVRGPAMLDALPAQDGAMTVRPPGLVRRVGAWPAVRALRGWAVRAAIEREATRLAAATHAPVVYHEPNMIAKPFRGPTVVTFNDLSWHDQPGVHPPDRIAWIGRRLPATLRQATRFVAISRFTADGMVRALGLERAQIDVVPLAPSPLFRPYGQEEAAPVLARHGLADRGYILSVSTLEPRKNFDGLLVAWLRLPAPERLPLAIVGARGWGTVLAGGDAQRAQASGQLRLLGPLRDAELAALYARCAVFTYVSLYEGFGLPLLEAMASGAAVVASGTTACGETAGDAALLVDPADPGAVAEAMRAAISDPVLAASLRAKGLAHASGYTWPRTVALLMASWTRAVTEHG